MPKVLIGITTYNRKNILELMAKSLYGSDLSIKHAIRVYDDKSTEYGEEELREIFPDAESVYIRSINVGADLNTWGMYFDFVESNYDYLFNADSDLIFNSRWLETGLRYIDQTDGVLSLFNTAIHKEIKKEGDLVVKGIFGAAGTLFSRKAIEELVEANKNGDFSPSAIDWGFCKYFTNQNKKLYCTSKSYVQHIGIKGFNCGKDSFVYGENFEVDSLYNGQAINDVLCSLEESKIENQDIPGYYLFPFDKVERNSRIVIYGSGLVGRDYKRQVELIGFCNIAAVVDKTYDNTMVFSPEIIRDLRFDYILIATANKTYVREIKEKIYEICPDLSDNNIIVADERKIRI